MNFVVVTGDGTLAAATRDALRLSPHVHLDQRYEKFGLCVLWICHDTPLVDGKPANDAVLKKIREDIKNNNGQAAAVLISSQIPIGTTKLLESEFPGVFIAYSPENIRVKTALSDFKFQERIVIGRRDAKHDKLFDELLAPFTKHLIFTDPETAEMVKHALNTFLGINIAFANEMADLCKRVGANMTMVTTALRSERRISPNAPLVAGGPFESGHLERDFYTLLELSEPAGGAAAIPLIAGAMLSNTIRKQRKQNPEA